MKPLFGGTVFLALLTVACGAAPISRPSTAKSNSAANFSASTPEQKAIKLALDFWRALSARDYAAASALASYPFDMDSEPECLTAIEALNAHFDKKPLPDDMNLVVGEASPVFANMDLAAVHEHWHNRIPDWIAPNSPCLGPSQVNGTSVVHHSFLVNFTINDKPVGALTRIRCVMEHCGVAGIDN